MVRSSLNRFWKNLSDRPDTGCWLWQGCKDKDGYGKFGSGKGNFTTFRAHRIVYELLVGPIPSGMQIDHLCRNRACCNPDHLEPVTGKTNTLRGIGVTAINARKTHCPNGHPYSGDNLRIAPNGDRVCKECHKTVYYTPHPKPPKTHCKYGHLFDEENTLHKKDGERACRTCARDRARLRRHPDGSSTRKYTKR